MLRQLTDRNIGDVREALARADGKLKVAVLLLQGCDIVEATAILDGTNGRLREAMAMVEKRKLETGRGEK
jgi:N-acetylmuramic acid 6-phosphate (MurNAc-6-P) etherase